MTLPKVLIFNTPTQTDLGALKAFADVTSIPSTDEHEQYISVEAAVKDHGPFDAWACFPDWTRPMPSFNRKMLGSLAGSCKLFVGPGAGYEKVEMAFINDIGAYFANVPNAIGRRAADGTIMLLLATMKGLVAQDRSCRIGGWRDTSNEGVDWNGATLGVIGLGLVGRRVADVMSSAFGSNIIYTNKSGPIPNCPYEWVTIDQLYSRSDVISVNPLCTPETTGMLNKETFGKMKKGVIIVNSSRGKVIVEEDLVEALGSGQVLRAGLDGFEKEPAIHPGLIDNYRVTLSPHYLAVNNTILKSVEEEIIDNLRVFFKTGKPNTPVNEAAIKASLAS